MKATYEDALLGIMLFSSMSRPFSASRLKVHAQRTTRDAILEDLFTVSPYPTLENKIDVSILLRMPRFELDAWFQSRRNRVWRSGCVLMGKRSDGFGTQEILAIVLKHLYIGRRRA